MSALRLDPVVGVWCEFCHATGHPKRMPFYFVGEEMRHVCDDEECREAARREIRGETWEAAA